MFSARWPEGFCCPKCKTRRAYARQDRPLYECAACGYQASVTADTIFHRSHVPLTKWFLAMYLNAESKRGISHRVAGQDRRLLSHGVVHALAAAFGHGPA